MKKEKVIWDQKGLPPKSFWDDHWKNGGGKTVVIPAHIIFEAVGDGLGLAKLAAF